MHLLRSLAFNLAYLSWSLIVHVIFLPALLGPRSWTVAVAKIWIRGALWLLRVIVGLDHREFGLEHLPNGPAIVAAKHQSAWETLFFVLRFNMPSIILKRELLKIPIFGWFLTKAGMIAVDRSGGASALKQMARQARDAFDQGRQLLIFPEGTRVAPGEHRKYQAGIAALYGQLDVPVVPVALNSGLFWGRKSFVKRPGTITVQYLPAIPPGLDKRTFMAELERRIETSSDALAKQD